MATVTYVGPWRPGAEVLHLIDITPSFDYGVAVEVPDDRLGTLRENPLFQVDGQQGQSAPPAPEPEVHTTAPDNQPTVPDPAAVPAEGN